MDIFGSTLTSPTVSWTMSPTISSNHLKRSSQKQNQETSGSDQPERLSHHRNYQTTEWEPVKGSISGYCKLKELFRRANKDSSDEAQPLLINRPKNEPVIPREKLKKAGKKFRKALLKSIRYMALGMENMSSMIYISANVPGSVYYGRTDYESRMPYY